MYFFIIAGDLTDAKDHSRIFSEQYKEEWEVYHRVLKETQVEAKTDWLDIRGNHGEKGWDGGRGGGGPLPHQSDLLTPIYRLPSLGSLNCNNCLRLLSELPH